MSWKMYWKENNNDAFADQQRWNESIMAKRTKKKVNK